MRAGVVVAGGRSERFGPAEKALATVDGQPMLRLVALALAPHVDELVVNCRHDQRDAFADALAGVVPTPRFAPDPRPDTGPVAGALTALRTTTASHAVVAACDQPFLDPGTVESLFEAANDHGAIPRADGTLRPFGGVYGVTPTKEACEAVVARGGESMREVASFLDPEVVDVQRAAPFLSVDTRADLAAARRDAPTNGDTYARGE
ncbi:molybdenum cofactor guanylyltransferase [Halarchaeum sp. P4]|uniref:molybdenum cofactor guanylyltransferase n=1 Tax=Halarchaeum sp. P4 TaxID=3421639 RepID=UPI003EBFD620